MKQNHTHITIILDRSGSMESIRADTIGGFNAFLQQQQAEPGTATLTLVQFEVNGQREDRKAQLAVRFPQRRPRRHG